MSVIEIPYKGYYCTFNRVNNLLCTPVSFEANYLVILLLKEAEWDFQNGCRFIYFGFNVAFNTVQVISRRVVGRAEETST